MPADPYQTRDLYLAAALITVGRPLLGLEERDGRYWFAFPADPGATDDVVRYFSARLSVDARTYADHLRGLKVAMAEGRQA